MNFSKITKNKPRDKTLNRPITNQDIERNRSPPTKNAQAHEDL